MDHHTRQQEHLLVLEPDESLQDFLSDLLSEEGYQVSVAASLEEGLACVERQSFALILADLFVGHALAGSFTPAHTVCRRVQPTPVGLLMTLSLSAAEAQRAGFAFVLERPFEVEDLLSLVAEALQIVFTAEQERQADVVRRYLVAQRRWPRTWRASSPCVLAMCATARTPALVGTTARRLQGQTALRAYVEAMAQHSHQMAFAAVQG